MTLTGTNGATRITFNTGEVLVPNRTLIYQDGIRLFSIGEWSNYTRVQGLGFRLSSIGEWNNYTIQFAGPVLGVIDNKQTCAIIARAKGSYSRANMCFCMSPSANNNSA